MFQFSGSTASKSFVLLKSPILRMLAKLSFLSFRLKFRLYYVSSPCLTDCFDRIRFWSFQIQFQREVKLILPSLSFHCSLLLRDLRGQSSLNLSLPHFPHYSPTAFTCHAYFFLASFSLLKYFQSQIH